MGILQSMGLMKKEETPVKKSTPTPATTATVVTSAAIETSIPTTGNDYNKIIEDEFREKNPVGLDYLEFRDAVKLLDGQPLSEEQKYVATFPTYSAQGITADKLIQSADYYANVLGDVAKQFEGEMKKTEDIMVTSKSSAAKKLDEEIELLTKQIQEKQLKSNQLKEEASRNQSQLTAERIGFDNTVKAKMAVIEEHKNKINQYLKK